MIEDPRIDQIRELVARHRANVHKDAVPDELDVLLGIDVNDPVQRYANLLVKLSSILDSAPPAPAATPWSCVRCGSDRWVGWRAGPEHEGWPRKAQCVPCGFVQALPVIEDPTRSPEERAIPEPEGTQP